MRAFVGKVRLESIDFGAGLLDDLAPFFGFGNDIFVMLGENQTRQCHEWC
jgi:hypothetical protein